MTECFYTILQYFEGILSEFKWINYLLIPLKSPENYRFSNNFRGNRTSLIRFNSHIIWSLIWRRSLKIFRWPLNFIQKSKKSLKSRTLTFQKNLYCLLHWKSFRNHEKCFYFILKALFVLKTIWKMELTSKFMTSHPG